MTGVEIVLAYGAYRLFTSWVSGPAPVSAPRRTLAAPPGKIITFVGATGAGKSSALNALLGYPAFVVGLGHGSTTTVEERELRGGYRLRDTPGLMDRVDYTGVVWEAIWESRLVIVTATEELYRPEVELVEQIATEQRRWDREAGTPGQRELALFINREDVREATWLPAERAELEITIREQVAAWIPGSQVLFGAAAPVVKGVRQPPRIDTLRAFVERRVGEL